MEFEQVKISHFNGLNLGVILVLFILLLIVVRIFPGPSEASDGNISVLASIGFDIDNSSNIPLTRTFIYGDFEQPYPSANLPSGGSNRFELKIEVFTVTAGVIVYSSPGIEVSFTPYNSAWPTFRTPDINNIKTTGPIKAEKASNTRLVISNLSL
ncbi:hypothetical protein [Paenibacillus herberti]|uniref:Uncharacterized protein n=1 Tax=Paenibacillus herberti TaxID=1619309 RepID=A0A229NVR3_9BACL|nr:hypothetical protein [Paenibacillus herberti]OXM14007.1 hypothetical protein CGZ75_13475 [Paenibacillus herberti]